MTENVGVEIKQEQNPEQVWQNISPGIIKTDLDDVKSEIEYCMNYDNCSNNLPSENELFLKEGNVRLEVTEGNLVNKIDIDQHEIPTHIILKCKENYEVTDVKGEIDLSNIVVKSEDQFCANCDENSSDNLPGKNGLVSKDCPTVEVTQSSEALESECDSDVKHLVNKIDCDQQDVSRQAFFQQNVELQTDIIKLKQVEKKNKDNRNKTSNRKEKNHKCHFCDHKSARKSNLKQHMLTIHPEGNVGVYYYCQQCTFKTLHQSNLCKHIRLHEEKAPYKCPACDKSFNRKTCLDNHLLTNHDSLQHLITRKIHYCKFCTYKTVNSIGYLTRHIAYKHNKDGAEKFQCHKCDYFALEKGHLKRHLLVHSNSRPYLCTACQKRFNRKDSLDRHILSKHKENADLLKSITIKFQQCIFCTYKTINSHNFYRHMKSKHKQSSE